MDNWKLVWKNIFIIVIRYVFLEKETFLKWNYQMNEMCTLFGWIKITTFVAGIIEIKMKENEYYQNTQIIRHKLDTKLSITIHKIRWEVSFVNKLHTISDIIRTTFSRKDESSSVAWNFREEGNNENSCISTKMTSSWYAVNVTIIHCYFSLLFLFCNLILLLCD